MALFPIPIQPRGASNRSVLEGLKSRRISYPVGFRFWARFRVRFANDEFTPDADTDQELALNTLYPYDAFPESVRRLPGTFIRLQTPISGTGITAATLEVGDTGDTDGLFTATSAFGGVARVLDSTPAAAENAPAFESAFLPTLRVRTTGGNVAAIEAGEAIVCIPFRKLPL